MNNYIGKERISDNHFDITFDLKAFSEFQKGIATKYEAENDFICIKKGCSDFIVRFDRYILHCLEEIVEARQEIRKAPMSEDSLYELADILLYLGTMNSIIKINLDYFQMKTQDIIRLDYYISRRTPNDIDIKLMDVSELLIEQRRLFPQRKWHKPSNEFPELQVKYIMNEIYNKNIKAMEIVLDLLLNCAKQRHNVISDALNMKQQFIKNLPLNNLD